MKNSTLTTVGALGSMFPELEASQARAHAISLGLALTIVDTAIEHGIDPVEALQGAVDHCHKIADTMKAAL